MSLCTDQSILTLVKIQKDRYPNKGFLFFKELEVTYQQFFDRMEQVAYGLARFKIESGDKIAICLPNCPESLFAFFGILRRGGIAVPLSPDLKQDQVAKRLNRSQSRVLITTASLYASMQLQRMELPRLEQLFFVGDRGRQGFVFSSLYVSGPKKKEIAVSPKLLAVLMYPLDAKGESFTQENLIADADVFVGAAQMTEQDCFLYPLPWLDSHRQIISILASIIVGGSVILTERFSPKGFLNAIARHHTTALFGGKEMIKDLFESEEAKQYDLSSLRFCACE